MAKGLSLALSFPAVIFDFHLLHHSYSVLASSYNVNAGYPEALTPALLINRLARLQGLGCLRGHGSACRHTTIRSPFALHHETRPPSTSQIHVTLRLYFQVQVPSLHNTLSRVCAHHVTLYRGRRTKSAWLFMLGGVGVPTLCTYTS